MSDLGLVEGYKVADTDELPQMSLRKMFRLSLRTWPYMRPMLKHLYVILAFALAAGLLGMAAGFIGTDLFTNKVLIGEKLQPIQVSVLFVGDEYVTTDPVKLGQGPRKESSGNKASGKGKAAGKGTLVTAAEDAE